MIAENGIHLLFPQTFHQDPRACEFHVDYLPVQVAKKAAPLTSGTAFGSFFLQAQPFCTPRQPYGIVPIMEIMATKMDAIMASIIMAIIERALAAQEDTASALAAAATV